MISCRPSLNVAKMQPDKQTGIYLYKKNTPLFTSNGDVLTRINLDTFLTELANNGDYYDFDKDTESDLFITKKDADLTHLYSSVIDCINKNNCGEAIQLSNKFKKDYTLAERNTDINFLIAFSWEKSGNPDSARHYYNRFLKKAGRKYSTRFRGYAIFDSSAVMFANERNYANLYLRNNKKPSEIRLLPIKPKYYYESFSQGYVLNREDLGMTNKRIYSAGIGIVDKDHLMYGFGITELLSDRIVINASYYMSSWQNYLRITTPIQIFKSTDNRFGIKIAPTCDYAYVSQINTIQTINDWYINPGITPSAGFKITHRLFLGASYSYCLFNQNNMKTFTKYGHNVFAWTELDVSLYYQLIKGISVKFGTSNKYPIVGLNLMGIFIGYSTNPHAMMVRFNDF
jgi:hypothetical protein